MTCLADCCVGCFATGELIQVWIEVSFEIIIRVIFQIARLGPIVIVVAGGGYAFHRLKNPRFKGEAAAKSGHTLEINGKKVRIFGIVALYQGQKVFIPGIESDSGFEFCREALEGLVKGKTVTCWVTEWNGALGRIEGRCIVDGKDIGQRMVKDGYAFADLDYSSEYLDNEKEAEKKKRGFHRSNPTPDHPKEWQRRKERKWLLDEYKRKRLPDDPTYMTVVDLRKRVGIKFDVSLLDEPG